ncbi:hypothetical protein [Bradyrhizobium sp. SZCCHNR2009]|uniref:hypothetical protein n=1 Tax=Bradyrhizobium sp. SZCCHNR2009 TaxID=3057375 RepID=UPI0028EE728D|nr:hypothetical protein [Bradyrhizobium sp. SZCCHNR2009]
MTVRVALFVGVNEHAAARHAHRIPHPTFVTIAKRPLLEAGCAQRTTISEKAKQKNFSQKGWTGRDSLKSLANFAFWRTACEEAFLASRVLHVDLTFPLHAPAQKCNPKM